jgi:hypothetical protein
LRKAYTAFVQKPLEKLPLETEENRRYVGQHSDTTKKRQTVRRYDG